MRKEFLDLLVGRVHLLHGYGGRLERGHAQLVGDHLHRLGEIQGSVFRIGGNARKGAAPHDFLVREAHGFVAEDDCDLFPSCRGQELACRSARIEQRMRQPACTRAQSHGVRRSGERLLQTRARACGLEDIQRAGGHGRRLRMGEALRPHRSFEFPDEKMHPMLGIAVRAARRAGASINRAARDVDLLPVTRKRHNDFVTEVDKAAEQAVIEILHRAYPDHAILAEESGASAGKAGESEYTWIIDPVDGTRDFIHGFPQYAVSVALRHKGVLTQAVIYDPTDNELFTATRGRGAYLNERRIRVSKRVQLSEALIGTGFPFRDLQGLDEYLAMFRELTLRTAGLRRAGAAALDIAYVAAGRLDGFWEMGLSPWDMAAGALLVQEAGGLVGDFRGDSGYLDSGRIVCGSPKIFAQLLHVIGPLAAKK